jgi:hypothetical protein
LLLADHLQESPHIAPKLSPVVDVAPFAGGTPMPALIQSVDGVPRAKERHNQIHIAPAVVANAVDNGYYGDRRFIRLPRLVVKL